MLHFLARRIVSALSVVLVTLVATFALFFVAPTDPAGAICGQRNCPQERYEEIKKNLLRVLSDRGFASVTGPPMSLPFSRVQSRHARSTDAIFTGAPSETTMRTRTRPSLSGPPKRCTRAARTRAP